MILGPWILWGPALGTWCSPLWEPETPSSTCASLHWLRSCWTRLPTAGFVPSNTSVESSSSESLKVGKGISESLRFLCLREAQLWSKSSQELPSSSDSAGLGSLSLFLAVTDSESLSLPLDVSASVGFSAPSWDSSLGDLWWTYSESSSKGSSKVISHPLDG